MFFNGCMPSLCPMNPSLRSLPSFLQITSRNSSEFLFQHVRPVLARLPEDTRQSCSMPFSAGELVDEEKTPVSSEWLTGKQETARMAAKFKTAQMILQKRNQKTRTCGRGEAEDWGSDLFPLSFFQSSNKFLFSL